MGCGVYWKQIREVERALGSLSRLGISELSPAFLQLSSLRGSLLTRVGIKFPRTISSIMKLVGLSPGSITLWHDVESGWMSEGRERPGALPVYHYISDEQAVAILNKTISPELHEYFMTPDPYHGE